MRLLTFFLLLSLPLGFCYAEISGVNIFNQEEQENSDIDQIQNSLREYAIASKKYVNNPLGWSALNYAIHMKDFQSALILAIYCTNINQIDPYKKGGREKINALERLFYIDSSDSKRHLSEVEIQLTYVLLDNGIRVRKGFFSPIAGACWFNIDDLIVHFTELGADVNCGSGTPLYYLIENGNLNMARYLIDKGANLKWGRPLIQAAINGQKIESVDFLIDLDVDLYINNGIDHATHAFSFLKKEIKNIDKYSDPSFPAFEVFYRVLELGANPNMYFYSGNYEEALNRCLLWQALELPDKTNTQHFYKNIVIQVLLDHGAVLP